MAGKTLRSYPRQPSYSRRGHYIRGYFDRNFGRVTGVANESLGENSSKSSSGGDGVRIAQADLTCRVPLTAGRKSLRGAAKRSATRARELEQQVWTLLSKGKTPTAIGQEVGIARESVHRLIRRVERRYRESILVTVDELKSKHARALSAVVEEALEAFERSKQPAHLVRRTTGKKGGITLADGSDAALSEKQVETQVGDVRYLTEARGALTDIRKIYGIGAPYENFSQTSQAALCDPDMPSDANLTK